MMWPNHTQAVSQSQTAPVAAGMHGRRLRMLNRNACALPTQHPAVFPNSAILCACPSASAGSFSSLSKVLFTRPSWYFLHCRSQHCGPLHSTSKEHDSGTPVQYTEAKQVTRWILTLVYTCLPLSKVASTCTSIDNTLRSFMSVAGA